MEHSHLFELIQTLSPAEKTQVLPFAAIPLFNQSRMKAQVIQLLEVCFRYTWENTNNTLDKGTVYSIIFPEQEYVEGKIEKVMVEAHKVVRSFLLAQQYFRGENEFNQNLDFSEIARLRNLETRYRQSLSKLQKAQDESLWKNETHFQHQFLLEKAIHDGETYRNQIRGDLNIPQTLYALEAYYHISQLTLLNFFLLQKTVANLAVPPLIQHLLKKPLVSQVFLEKSSPLRIKQAIFGLLSKEHLAPNDVRELFDLVLSLESTLDAASLREFYTYLRNICVLVSNTYFDNEEIRITLFDLYKDNLRRGYLHYEGKLHPSTYISVSLAAVRVKHSTWALEFIEKYKHDLMGENETQDIYRFNKALYLFGVGRFSECLDNIPDTSPAVDYLMHGKRLELQALYELRSDLLFYRLDAFRMFLSRTSQKLLSETQRQKNIEFVNLLTQLSTSIPGDRKRAERMVLRIQEKRQAAEWRWLLEKAKALKEN